MQLAKVCLLVLSSVVLVTASGEIANPPVLLCEANSTRAIALDAYTFKPGPFSVTTSLPGAANDPVSRILLFAKNLHVLNGNPSSLTADAEDSAGRHYPLTVERVNPVPGNEWLMSLVVRLNANMDANAGDVLVKISVGNVPSNRVRVAIGRVGGGKPDDDTSLSMPYVLEFDGSPQTVDYGLFFPPFTDLGKFFWEFWAMPGPNADARYLLTDGYGGAHALLFGFFRAVELEHYSLYGNIWDGTNITVFVSDDGPLPGEWGHFAVGWDGNYVVTYYNGVPVGKVRFVGPRRSPGGDMGGGRLLIGGSDHNNLIGRIAQVRGYEGVDLLQELPGEKRTTAAFVPDSLFDLRSVNGGPNCTLLTRFLRSAQTRVQWLSNLGVSISGNNVTKTGPTGWSGGASSSLSITSGEGFAEVVAGSPGTRKMFGVTNVNVAYVPGEMDYAILLEHTGQVAVFVSRQLVGFLETYVPGDRLRISVSRNSVQFIKNGSVFYTSNTAPNFPLRIDASPFHTGATINDAVIGGTLAPVSQPEQVPDLAGGLIGRIRGVRNGIGDPGQTFPLPAFVADSAAPNAATLSGEGVTSMPSGSAPRPPESSLVFDSFTRKSATYAFDGVGGLNFVEGGSNPIQPWRFAGPNEALYGPTRFGILNGRAVILSNGPGIAWVPTGSSNGDVEIRVDRRNGPFGSGIDTGLCFRVVDGRNFFFAYTGGNENAPRTDRTLTVGYWLNGVQTKLVSGLSMPEQWTTLHVIARSDGTISVLADGSLVCLTTSTVLTEGRGAGLYNAQPGMGLVNRWDNFTVIDAPTMSNSQR